MSRSDVSPRVWIVATLLFWALPPLLAQSPEPAGSSPVPSRVESQAAQPAFPAEPVGPEEVVITVGNFKITAAEFEKIAASLPPQFSGAMNTMGKKAFADQYANLLGLALEGEKRQMDQREPFRQMMAFQRLVLLAQLTLNELVVTLGAVSPEEVQYYFASHQSEFTQVNPAHRRGRRPARKGPSSLSRRRVTRLRYCRAASERERIWFFWPAGSPITPPPPTEASSAMSGGINSLPRLTTSFFPYRSIRSVLPSEIASGTTSFEWRKRRSCLWKRRKRASRTACASRSWARTWQRYEPTIPLRCTPGIFQIQPQLLRRRPPPLPNRTRQTQPPDGLS